LKIKLFDVGAVECDHNLYFINFMYFDWLVNWCVCGMLSGNDWSSTRPFSAYVTYTRRRKGHYDVSVAWNGQGKMHPWSCYLLCYL